MSYSERLLEHGNFLTRFAHSGRYRRALFSAAVLWDAHAFDSSHTQLDAPGTGHKGFDYRDVERELRSRMDIVRTVYSPFPPLGALLNSTVMWRCRTRATAAVT